MLQNIQKKLLLKYPLIWNTKLVPMLIFGIILHVIFFILGYIDGTIDFSNKNNIDIIAVTNFFAILVVILAIILWLVFYFKNNSLKSFYKKSKYSLFYEFIQILIICTLLTTYYIPFSIGKQLHQKSYYSLSETTDRCKTISTADIFIDGSFKNTEIDSLASGLIDSLGNLTPKGKRYAKDEYSFSEHYLEEDYATDAEYAIDEDNAIYRKDYIVFKGKRYDEYSLLNRNIYDFSVNSREQDSLNELEVKTWLHNNNKGRVNQLLKNYLSILHEHKLETNLELNKWIEIIYKEPKFEDFYYIHSYKKEYESYHYYNKYRSEFTGRLPGDNQNSKYSKFFIQHNILKEKYNDVSDAHTNNFIDFEALLVMLYIALGISILIFSFRVTSGKSWLISVVVAGVLNLFAGILAAIISESNLYLITILLIILVANLYFFYVYFKRENIQFSRITLNIALWGNPFVIPIVYNLIINYYYWKYSSYDNFTRINFNDSTEYKWLNDHLFEMTFFNYFLIIISFFFMSKVIRNWKGIPED